MVVVQGHPVRLVYVYLELSAAGMIPTLPPVLIYTWILRKRDIVR